MDVPAIRGERRTRRFRRGITRNVALTLIELLSAILFLASLTAIAMPLYMGAVSHSEVEACRANMRTIARVEQTYRRVSPTHQYTNNLPDLTAEMGSIPTCPSGGAYSVVISDGANTAQNGAAVPEGGLIVICSFRSGALSHGRYAPGVDSE